MEDEEKEKWGIFLSNSIADLILVEAYDVAKELALFSLSNQTLQTILTAPLSLEEVEDTGSILVAAYAMELAQKPQEGREALARHVEREIDNALEYVFRLNRDLLLINDTEEEGLLFEIPDKSNIEADAKEEALGTWLEREKDIIKQANYK